MIYNVDNFLTINLNYQDPRGGPCWIKYAISSDGYGFQDYQTLELPPEINNNYQSYTVNIKIEQLAYEKSYELMINGFNPQLDIYDCSSYNGYYNGNYYDCQDYNSFFGCLPIVMQFTIQLSTPVLSITKNPNEKYYKNKDQLISISGTLTDTNLGDVSLQYAYDSSTNFKLYETIKIESITESKQFTMNIPLDQTFSEGTHTIKIKAIDTFNKFQTLDPIKFDFMFNDPDLLILDYNEYNPPVYTKNLKDDLEIQIKLIDYNIVDTLKVDYEFEQTYFTGSVEFQMGNEIEKTDMLYIRIPSDLPENRYIVNLKAVETPERTSVVRKYYFIFKYNKPIITLNNERKEVYYKDTDKYVHISGVVRDERCNENIHIFCNIENMDDQTDTHVDLDNQCYQPFSLKIPISRVNNGKHRFLINSMNDKQESSEQVSFTTNITFRYQPSNFEDDPKIKHKFKPFSFIYSIIQYILY